MSIFFLQSNKKVALANLSSFNSYIGKDAKLSYKSSTSIFVIKQLKSCIGKLVIFLLLYGQTFQRKWKKSVYFVFDNNFYLRITAPVVQTIRMLFNFYHMFQMYPLIFVSSFVCSHHPPILVFHTKYHFNCLITNKYRIIFCYCFVITFE